MPGSQVKKGLEIKRKPMSYTLHAGHQICGGQGLPESHVWCSKAYELSAEPWNGTNNILKLIQVLFG